MTYALNHVAIDNDKVPCVVREDDGSYLTLEDTNAMIELKQADPEAFSMIMRMVEKLIQSELCGGLDA